jgi:putative hydrolase of the HAD superfamily
MADYYVTQSALKRHLFPYTLELLDALKDKFSLYIITNGFEEVQEKKLHSSGLRRYFKEVITSERAGKKKPDRHIFDYALELASANRAESIMIGDDIEVDIEGAVGAGIDQIYVNYRNLPIPPGMRPTYMVQDLRSVGKILLNGK